MLNIKTGFYQCLFKSNHFNIHSTFVLLASLENQITCSNNVYYESSVVFGCDSKILPVTAEGISYKNDS